MKNVLAFILSCVSAYALSFSADCLFGTIFRVYQTQALLPAAVWLVTAMITGLLAFTLAPGKRFLVVPFIVITGAAVIGGVIGQRYDLAVAGVMALVSVWAWLATSLPSAKSTPNH